MQKKLVLIFLSSWIFSACVTAKVPVNEYALAKAAYEAALASEAIKFAPQPFYKAEKSFKKGEQLYKDRYYKEARGEFMLARKWAEKAETTARVKQFNSGESSEE